MESKKSHLGWGIFLIAIGILFFIGNISKVGMEILWPTFPLAVGLAFLFRYFKQRDNPDLLMPGTILVIISLMFLYCTIFDWSHMKNLWPFFIIAPGVGFVAMYFGGGKNRELLVPAGILFGIGILFLFISTGLKDFWPIFLILAGIMIIALQLVSDKKKKEKPEE